MPASWWTTQHDRHLLFGSFKHGVGDWTEILSDPSLCFAGSLAPLDAKEKEKGEEEKKENEKEEKKKESGSKKKDEEKAKGDDKVEKKENEKEEEKKEDEKKDRTADGKLIWPGSKLVNIRLRKLLKHIETWKRTQTKAKKRPIAKKQKDPSYELFSCCCCC